MKQFWVDFSGYLKVFADTPEEAERKFWAFVNNSIDLSYSGMCDDVWDIEGIEEVVEGREVAVEGVN